MKRFIILFLIIVPALSLSGQSGSGTLADPFYGTISTARTWSTSQSPVYVGQSGTRNDLLIASGGSLDIQPGVIVIFTQGESDLRINGTGILRANGTNVARITFTNLSGNDYWGHIAFRNSTGTSVLNYCIIENGYSIAFGEGSSGGGIYANCNNLTISNCIIRNNIAPGYGGGGIYTASSPKIENCLIYSNYSSEYDGGGIFLAEGSSATVTNCTIVNNTAFSGLGDDVYFGSSDAIIKNTIIWRSSISYYLIYFADTYSSSNLTNCAIVEAYDNTDSEITTSFSTCVLLNVDNTAVNGPNFINPVTDLSISPVSPCRDSGTSSSTPGAAPPSTDILGNSRLGAYDIGAYEVQYVRWRTDASSTDWNSATNWTGGVPTSTSNVIIPAGAANYPVLTPAPDYTIGTGRYFIIESGACATLNSLTNNGTIEVINAATTSASLILGSYTRGTGGKENIKVTLTGGGTEEEDNFRWHFISTPVSSLNVSTFTGVTQDLVQYVESRPTLSLMQGWIGYDGYVYATGGYISTTFTALSPGKGYDYWHSSDYTFSFAGLFNTATVNAGLSYTATPIINLKGFNLLGNPFPSGLNWDYIINDASYPANTSKALYFTRDNVQCTYAGGVGIPSDVNGIIPPMQGFFNKTSSAGNTIVLSTAARTHSNIHSRYKKSDEVIPLVRLSITEKNKTDETVVRFDENAKPDLDLDFDALKMFTYTTQPYIYSVSSGTNYAINGQPFPEEEAEFPVVVNVPVGGSHKIQAKQIEGLDSYYVTLTDKNTGYSAELKKVPWLSFFASAGTIKDRFVLKVSTNPTGIETPGVTDISFNIYQTDDFIFIQPIAEAWQGKQGSVRLVDLTGKRLSELPEVEFNINSILQMQSPGRKGIYIVEIQSGTLRYTGKLLVN
jgi:hypothetical protein